MTTQLVTDALITGPFGLGAAVVMTHTLQTGDSAVYPTAADS
ncbi:hypothetical protein [Limnohabitans sp.]